MIRWTPDIESKVVGWARFWASRYRFSPDAREDLISECLVKAWRSVEEGNIHSAAGLNRLCQRKGLDMIRKLTRVRASEVEMFEVTAKQATDETTDLEVPLSATVEQMFPGLVLIARMTMEGYTLDEICEKYDLFPWEVEEYVSRERERAKSMFGV